MIIYFNVSHVIYSQLLLRENENQRDLCRLHYYAWLGLFPAAGHLTLTVFIGLVGLWWADGSLKVQLLNYNKKHLDATLEYLCKLKFLIILVILV